jgi:hypothetical protein
MEKDRPIENTQVQIRKVLQHNDMDVLKKAVARTGLL